MKQVLRIVAALGLGLGSFELYSLYAPPVDFMHRLVTMAVMILIWLCILYVISWGNQDRTEYIVTMSSGAYGRIGEAFEPQRYGIDEIQRLNSGFGIGIRTYRLSDGSLLFTVRHPAQRPSFSQKRLGKAIVIALLCGVIWGVTGEGNQITDTPTTPQAEAVQPTEETTVTEPTVEETPPEPTPESTTDTADTTDSTQSDSDSGWFSVITDFFKSDSEQDATQATASDTTQAEAADTAESDSGSGWFSGIMDFFNPHYILPSKSRILTEDDVAGMDEAQIQRAINEMYARHHYDLSGSADEEYFNEQSWYKPDASVTSSQVRAEFNDTENTNFDFLVSKRDQLRG